MQVDKPYTVVGFGIIGIRLSIIYSGGNNISNAGCKWIDKSNLKKLMKIDLSKNTII